MFDYFRLREAGTTPLRELWAGVTTFLAMAYILAVNPSMLSATGMPMGDVFTASCIAAALATGVMGLWARYPIALAPGMGLNAFFTFTICIGMKTPWQVALAAVFLAGVIFLILSLTGIREKILAAVPPVLVAGCAGGIGLFITFIGLQNAGIIVAHPDTLITFGDLSGGVPAYAAIGILLTFALVAARVPGALLWGILGTWCLLGLGGHAGAPTTWYETPALPATTCCVAFTHLGALFSSGTFITLVLTLVFVDLFDTMGTLLALTSGAGMLREDGTLPRANRAFAADAIGTITGGILGTSTVTSYIESGTGIAAGGRTGLTAVVVALLFLLALPFGPVVTNLPQAATAPALIMVGAFLLAPLKKISLADPVDSIPILVMLLGMPACFSIEKGLGFGFITYTVCRLAAGRHREISPLVALISLAFLARFICLPHA